MPARGAEFADFQPRNDRGILDVAFRELSIQAEGLEHGVIQQVTPNNSFRLGQQVFFYVGIGNPIFSIDGVPGSDNWITSLRLKLWWARPNSEFRQVGGGNGSPGADGFLPIDRNVAILNTIANNRYVWIPSPKRFDITPFDTPPPPAALARTSDSLMLDDVWKWDLQNANDPLYIADFPSPQIVSRWDSILYPAMGYALGFTWEAETAFPAGGGMATPIPLVSLTFTIGTLGGTNYQESLG